MNFALALTANRIPGVSVDIAGHGGSPATEQDELQMEMTLLHGRAAPHTHDVVMQEMQSTQTTPVAVVALTTGRTGKGGRDPFAPAIRGSAPISQPALGAALLLGSPEFQRR
jgi:hypothetical protein